MGTERLFFYNRSFTKPIIPTKRSNLVRASLVLTAIVVLRFVYKHFLTYTEEDVLDSFIDRRLNAQLFASEASPSRTHIELVPKGWESVSENDGDGSVDVVDLNTDVDDAADQQNGSDGEQVGKERNIGEGRSTSRGLFSTSLSSLPSLLDQVERDGIVVLTVVNRAFEPFLKNWECYARPILGRRFLVLANNYEFGRRLSEEGYHVYVQVPDDQLSGASDKDLKYGTVDYQRLILSRTELVAEFLRHGRSVLIADNDAVWLSDPFVHINADPSNHIVASNDGTPRSPRVLCGGFLFLRSTPKTLQIWEEVTEHHQALVERAMRQNKLARFAESEQVILTKIVKREEALALSNTTDENFEPLRVHLLDQLYFPSGSDYFTLRRPQLAKVTPVVIHNNYIIGKKEKLRRFKKFNLWSLITTRETLPTSSDGEIHAKDPSLKNATSLCHVAPYNSLPGKYYHPTRHTK